MGPFFVIGIPKLSGCTYVKSTKGTEVDLRFVSIRILHTPLTFSRWVEERTKPLRTREEAVILQGI